MYYSKNSELLYFQRYIVMRQFHFSHEQVKHDYSLPRAYAVICGRFNITVNRDYLHAQSQGKLDNVCLQQFSNHVYCRRPGPSHLLN